MISANTAAEIEKRRQAFLRKWTLKCRAVADSLEEAGNRLFSFTRLDPSQWKSARTTNAIERLNEEFRCRIKTQAVLPCAETVPMLLWALLSSGQVQMRKVDGWKTLSQPLVPMSLDLAA
jgi:putative transposase